MVLVFNMTVSLDAGLTTRKNETILAGHVPYLMKHGNTPLGCIIAFGDHDKSHNQAIK